MPTGKGVSIVYIDVMFFIYLMRSSMHFLSILALLLACCSVSIVPMDQESSGHKKGITLSKKSREAVLKTSQGEIMIDCPYPVSPRNPIQSKSSLGKIVVSSSVNTSPQSPRAQVIGLPHDGKKL